MPLEDYLIPGEQVKFQSTPSVRHVPSRKVYKVIVTDRRIILFAERGMVFKSDDVITAKMDELQGIRYSEQGVLDKKGIIHIDGKTRLDLSGSANQMKALYQQMMQFM